MMHDWQVPIFIAAMAEVARMEGMKAENEQRKACGSSMAYVESDFSEIAIALDALSRDARG